MVKRNVDGDRQSLRGFLRLVETEYPDELLRVREPIDLAIRSSRMRITTSLALPPANGTMTWMGRVGYACADAVTGAANSPTAAAATYRRRERRMDFPS